MLADPGVIDAMVRAFEQAAGHLADRLLAAMQAGQAQGGEAGPVHSAALLVVDDVLWPIVNLRVDWADEDPIGASNDSGRPITRNCRTTSTAPSTRTSHRAMPCRG
jgi:uncharacterized Ntn-hydrolase superfamily protein